MEDNIYIFTEAFNCGKLLSICLQSFHRHNDYKVHIIGRTKDFDEAGDIINHPNNVLINWDNNEDAKNGWANGHQGTALAFAKVMKGGLSNSNYVIHFDADCYFKGESINDIIILFHNGYDIIGTPRPYKNNLSGVKGLDNTPDCVSTYLMGVNTNAIPDYDFDLFVRMCGGWASPTRDRVLDFFDPVTHSIIRNGGKIYFLDTVKYGGIDLNGSKFNGFNTNLNFDCGTNIVHFGGVGSGKAIADKYSSPPKSYADWAYYRWDFYSHLFFGTPRDTNVNTVLSSPEDHQGKRWCAGHANDEIIEFAKKDIFI